MAEINFDAVLVDALSAPLQAIADNLIKVSDAVTAMSQNLKDSFDANTVAVETLTTAVEVLSISVDDNSVAVDALTTSINSGLVPAIEFATEYIDLLITSQDNLVAALDRNTISTDANTVALDANSTVMLDLTTAIQNLIAALGAMATAQAATSVTIDNSVNVTNNYTTVINNNTRALQQNRVAQEEEATAGEAGSMARAGGYGAILGATMLLGMAGAAVKVGIDLVKMGADGEAALNHVAALTGASADQMTYYKSQIEALAPVAGKTISDLSNGLYDIVSAGYQGADAMNVLNYAAKAAAAGETDLHTVTVGVTSVMRSFGLSADQASTATDVLIEGVRLGRAPFADFSRAIGLVGVVSSEAGIGIGDATAALSTLTLTYPSVRNAGQGLQALILDLSANAGTLADRAHKMGLEFDENALKSIPTLSGKLAYLQKVTGGNEDEMKKLLANSAALKAELFLTGQGASILAQNEQAMAGAAGMTDAAFKTHTATMKAHVEEMTGALSVLAIHISALAEPMINAALSALTQMFTALATAFEKHANIMKPLLIALAVLIGSTLVAAIIALSVILSSMATAALGIAGPIIAVELAIAALVTALIYAYNHSGPFRDAINQLWGAIKQLGQALGSGVIALIQGIGKYAREAAQGFGDLFGHMQPVQQSFDTFQTVTENVNGHMVKMRREVEGVKTVLVEVRGPLSPVVDGIRWFTTEVGKLTDKIKELLPHTYTTYNTFTGVSVVTEKVNGHIVHFHEQVTKVIPVVHHAGLTLHELWDKFHKVLGVVAPFLPLLAGLGVGFGVFRILKSLNLTHLFLLVQLLVKVHGGLSLLVRPFAAVSSAFMGAMRMGFGFRGALQAVLHLITGGLINAIKGVGMALWGLATNPFVLVAVGIAAVVALLVFAFIHWWKTSEQFREIVKTVIGTLADLGKTIMAQVHPIIKTLIDVWKHNLLPAIHQGQQLFNTLKPVLLAIAAVITGGLLVAFATLIGLLKGLVMALSWVIQGAIRFAAGLFQTIVGEVKLIIDVLKGLFTIFKDLFSGNFSKLGSDVKNLLGKLAGDVGNIFHGMISMIVGLIQGLPGAVFKLLAGFVTGFLGFFAHIFDKLVGHSIVPEMVLKIIWWIATLPLRLLEIGVKIIGALIGTFLKLAGELPKLALKAVGAIVGAFAALPGMLAGIIGKAATAVIHGLGNMAKGGLHAVGGLIHGIGGLFGGGHHHAKKTTDAMSADVVKSLKEMHKGGTTAVAALKNMSIQHIEAMAHYLIKKIHDTKNPVEKAMLEMQLKGVEQMAIMKMKVSTHATQMHTNVTKSTQGMLTTVIAHLKTMATQAATHASAMKTHSLAHIMAMHRLAIMHAEQMRAALILKMQQTKDPVVKHMMEMKLKSLDHFITMQQKIVQHAQVMSTQSQAHALAMKVGIIAHFLAMKNTSMAHAKAMKEQTLTHFIDMNIRSVQHLHDMATKIQNEMKNTKDASVKHALEMKLQTIQHLTQMHEHAISMAVSARAKLEANAKAQATNVVNAHKGLSSGVLGEVGKMASDLIAKAKGMGDDTNTHFTHMHKQTLDTFDDMNVKATGKFHDLGNNLTKSVSGIPGQATQWGSNIGQNLANGINSAKGAVGSAVQGIASEIAALIGFHSPTKKGPGRDADKWVPNLVNMMTDGFERGGGPMGRATAKFADTIKKGILTGAGSGLTADGGILRGSRGAPLVGGAGNGTMNVTIKLEGSMGAGLALLNAADRKRYVQQIADELAQQSRIQGRVENGYSGY